MKIWKKIILVIIIVGLGCLYAYGDWPKAIYDTSIGSGSYETTTMLVDNAEVVQGFKSAYNGLEAVEIKMALFGKENIGEYKWTIKDVATDKIVKEGQLSKNNIQKKTEKITCSFPKIKDSKGKSYTLSIKANEVKDEEGIGLYKTEKGDYEEGLTINDEKSEKALIIKVKMKRFSVETFVVFLGLALYVAFFIKFMYRLFK